jgi:hypothetical protein
MDRHVRMISRLPELSSITIEENHRVTGRSSRKELDIIEEFHQANPRLEFVGFKYFHRWPKYWEVTWKAATTSVIESSRFSSGNPCIWTPDPRQQRRWDVWIDTFGANNVTQRAMLERWPESPVPTILDLAEHYWNNLLQHILGS